MEILDRSNRCRDVQLANGTSIIKGARTKAGEVCVMEIELSGSGDQQNAIQGASYLMVFPAARTVMVSEPFAENSPKLYFDII